MAKTKSSFRGLVDVQRNLAKAIEGVIVNNAEGIALAGKFVEGEAKKLTPVDEGTLRLSAFSKSVGTKENPAVVIGNTAEYAAAVHEAPMTLKGQPRSNFGKTGGGESFGGGSGKGNYWDGGENKFLEKAVINNLSKIVNLIAKMAGRKPI